MIDLSTTAAEPHHHIWLNRVRVRKIERLPISMQVRLDLH
jgi:hypothetical protein